MDRRELLNRVKEEAGLDDLRQADRAVRVIVGLLKSMLPDEIEEAVVEKLPPDLKAGWESVEPYPADILEREDLYFEGPGGEEVRRTPTITNG